MIFDFARWISDESVVVLAKRFESQINLVWNHQHMNSIFEPKSSFKAVLHHVYWRTISHINFYWNLTSVEFQDISDSITSLKLEVSDAQSVYLNSLVCHKQTTTAIKEFQLVAKFIAVSAEFVLILVINWF
jgi:hypothetical protein